MIFEPIQSYHKQWYDLVINEYVTNMRIKIGIQKLYAIGPLIIKKIIDFGFYSFARIRYKNGHSVVIIFQKR